MRVVYKKSAGRARRNPTLLTLVNPSPKKKAKAKPRTRKVKAKAKPRAKKKVGSATVVGRRRKAGAGKPRREPLPHLYSPVERRRGVSKTTASGRKRREPGWWSVSEYDWTPATGARKGKKVSVPPHWRFYQNEEKPMKRKRRTRKAPARRRTVRKNTARRRPARRRPARKRVTRRNPRKRTARRRPARRRVARRNPTRRRRVARRNPAKKATWLKFGLAGVGGYLLGRVIGKVVQQNAASLPPSVAQYAPVIGTVGGAMVAYFASKKVKALRKYQTPIVVGAMISVADAILNALPANTPGLAYLQNGQVPSLAGWQGTGSYWGDTGGQPVALTATALSEYVREPGMGEYVATGMGADPHGLDDGVIRGGLFGEPGDDGDFDVIADD